MSELATQPTIAPTRKVLMGAIAGVLTTAVLTWADNLSDLFLDWELDPDWAGFLTNPEVTPLIGVVVFAAVSCFFRDRK